MIKVNKRPKRSQYLYLTEESQTLVSRIHQSPPRRRSKQWTNMMYEIYHLNWESKILWMLLWVNIHVVFFCKLFITIYAVNGHMRVHRNFPNPFEQARRQGTYNPTIYYRTTIHVESSCLKYTYISLHYVNIPTWLK